MAEQSNSFLRKDPEAVGVISQGKSSGYRKQFGSTVAVGTSSLERVPRLLKNSTRNKIKSLTAFLRNVLRPTEQVGLNNKTINERIDHEFRAYVAYLVSFFGALGTLHVVLFGYYFSTQKKLVLPTGSCAV